MFTLLPPHACIPAAFSLSLISSPLQADQQLGCPQPQRRGGPLVMLGGPADLLRGLGRGVGACRTVRTVDLSSIVVVGNVLRVQCVQEPSILGFMASIMRVQQAYEIMHVIEHVLNYINVQCSTLEVMS